jgi:hypothetical protein
MVLVRSRISGLGGQVRRSRAGLWVRNRLVDLFVPRQDNVLGILRRYDGVDLAELLVIPAANLVTDAGDIFYAQNGVGEAPTNAFGIHEMATATPTTHGKADTRATAGWTFAASSQKAHDSTYPKTNDGDADNTGAGTDVATYRVSYTTGEANATIVGGLITNVTPGTAEPLLTGYDFAASFTKTSSDTLKVFVNHTLNGT